ncbi:ABC transporter substrate-binding protein [Oceanibaculum pacificum]|uniref:ABC transporter substrate-binding protein n=1 Tax=Oceanibaculum pacificum TaxID=580166 RepID=A0A154VYJ5_9PROT|nr:ABC transporter substrate-binding protein [Oceanibaculum pacificum]KZD06404.1 ABC transporter substrate-binding protein [Oceanibaculum pacificum]
MRLSKIAMPKIALAAGLWVGLVASMPVLAQESGVTADKIVLGQSAALEGPASALGQGMRQGLLAAFKQANDAGGVKGRQIELISYDDGYRPDLALQNTRKLIATDGVFALVGAVGTPTTVAAQPIATNFKIPFVGAFTGAGFLRDPALKNVVNIRASYDQETEAWIEHLTKDVDAKRIAILYQDDSFGRAGLSGVKKAMEKRSLRLVAEGSYYRNTTAVKTALLAIRKAKADAVVIVGTYKPVAEFIKLSRSLNMDPVFVNISFVGADALAAELGSAGSGVVVSQVVPDPTDASLPLVADFQAALKALDPEAKPGFISLEGYMVGRLMVKALDAIKGDISREALLDVIQSTGSFDLGGVTLNFGPDDNQGMDRVFMTVIQDDGSFKAVTSLAGVGG